MSVSIQMPAGSPRGTPISLTRRVSACDACARGAGTSSELACNAGPRRGGGLLGVALRGAETGSGGDLGHRGVQDLSAAAPVVRHTQGADCSSVPALLV